MAPSSQNPNQVGHFSDDPIPAPEERNRVASGLTGEAPVDEPSGSTSNPVSTADHGLNDPTLDGDDSDEDEEGKDDDEE
jgi:hypothetical protein